MKHSDLPKRWKLKLHEHLTAQGSSQPNKLSAGYFPSAGIVQIQFEDDSKVEFYYAFAIEAPEFREVAVFTEHCGYHLFPLYDGLDVVASLRPQNG